MALPKELEEALAAKKAIDSFVYFKQPDFAPELLQLTTLTNLTLRNCKFEQIPTGLSSLPKLNWLSIHNCPITQLPSDFGGLRGLINLWICNTLLQEIPEEIGACKMLRQVHLCNNKLKRLPDTMAELKNIYELDISENPLEEFPQAILQMPSLQKIKCRRVAIFHDNFRKFHISSAFLTALHKSKPPAQVRYSLYLLLSGDVEQCKDIPLEHLFYALKFPYILVQATAAKLLEPHADANYAKRPLQADDSLVVLGRTPYKRPVLREQMKNYNITIAEQIGNKTTHLVVGSFITDSQIEIVCNSDKCWILPKHIELFLEKSEAYFLRPQQAQNNNAEQLAHLSDLLWSNDENNVSVALQLMQGNGVPPQLITELFLINKNNSFSLPIRQQAKQLLQLNASAVLRQKLTSRRPALDSITVPFNGIKFYLADTELDWRKVKDYALRCVQRAPRESQWFDTLPLPAALELLAEWSKKPSYVFETLYVSVKRTDELLSCGTLRRVSLYTNYVPETLFCNLDLEELNLHYTKIEPILPRLVLFKELKKINLSCCHLQHFPKVFYEMPQLKNIKTDRNYFSESEINTDIFDVSEFKKGKITRRG